MLEIIIALAAAIFLGNTLAHRIRVTPAILLIFLGLALALLPAMHELREVGLPSYVILEIFLPIMLFWEVATPRCGRYGKVSARSLPPVPCWSL